MKKNIIYIIKIISSVSVSLMIFFILLYIVYNVDFRNTFIQNNYTPHNDKDDVLFPFVANKTVIIEELFTIDISSIQQGYLHIKTNNDEANMKISLTNKNMFTIYTYNNDYSTIPLSFGDGIYELKIYCNENDLYEKIYSMELNIELDNEHLPYIYPNEVINYNNNSDIVDLSLELTKDTQTELERIKLIYDFVIDFMKYDYNLENYNDYRVPDIDTILDNEKGVCYDYAVLTVAMLRINNIPSRVVTGHVDDKYHAWIEVYTTNEGWINNDLKLNPHNWNAIDITNHDLGTDSLENGYEIKYYY